MKEILLKYSLEAKITHKFQIFLLGDTAVIYMTINNMHSIDVRPEIINKNGQKIEYVFQTSFGALKV